MKKRKLPVPIITILILSLAMPVNAQLAGIFEDHPGSANLKSFPKWVRVTKQQPKDKKLIGKQCVKGRSSCFMNEWTEYLGSIKNLSPLEQIEQVNKHINDSTYVTDIANWGKQDYWETPLEFLKKSGDCEDYSIAKFYSLKELGFTNENMRVIVLMDNNIKEVHSILVVNHKGRELVLDNQVKQVVEAEKIHHYEPIYAVNELGWWRYQ